MDQENIYSMHRMNVSGDELANKRYYTGWYPGTVSGNYGVPGYRSFNTGSGQDPIHSGTDTMLFP